MRGTGTGTQCPDVGGRHPQCLAKNLPWGEALKQFCVFLSSLFLFTLGHLKEVQSGTGGRTGCPPRRGFTSQPGLEPSGPGSPLRGRPAGEGYWQCPQLCSFLEIYGDFHRAWEPVSQKRQQQASGCSRCTAGGSCSVYSPVVTLSPSKPETPLGCHLQSLGVPPLCALKSRHNH